MELFILKRIEEYLLTYINHIKDLILNKNALNYGKIKSKSITGKHLMLTYSQLKFMKLVNLMISQRYCKY